MDVANIHATCVALGEAGPRFGPDNRGVLLLGKSGSGKSDLALRLIGRGCELVSDDRCDLFVRGQMLCARAPERLARLMEVRGVGILELPHRAEAEIVLAVELVAPDGVPRLPQPERYRPPAPLPEVSAPDKVIWAAAFARNLFGEVVKKI